MVQRVQTEKVRERSQSAYVCLDFSVDFYIVGWVDPINWKTVAAAYASSFVFDLSHGICTALVLWFAAEPWVRKLLRVKHKFGLMQEESCSMPPCQGDSRTRQQ